MSKNKRKDSIPRLQIHPDFEIMFNSKSEADRGKLLSAIMAYLWHNVEPDNLDARLLGNFDSLKSFVDVDRAKYVKSQEEGRMAAQRKKDKIEEDKRLLAEENARLRKLLT